MNVIFLRLNFFVTGNNNMDCSPICMYSIICIEKMLKQLVAKNYTYNTKRF